MKTITIDQNIYNGAALYAQKNNISVQSIIEEGIVLFLKKAQFPNMHHPDVSYEDALKYVSTLSAKGGRSVPVDEDGREARTEKYML